jgi:ATP-dependent 26S proteasome regulatory subunit
MVFRTYIKAGYPLLWIKSHEEQRVLSECVHLLDGIEVSDSNGNKDTYKMYRWDLADGIRTLNLVNGDIISGDPLENTAIDPLLPLAWLDEQAEDNTILFLNDYHPFLVKEFQDSTLITRKIRNLAGKFKAQGKALVILSAGIAIPMELEKEMTLIDYKLPGRDELKTVLHELCQALETPRPSNDETVIDASQGMTVIEAENAYAAAYQETGEFDTTIILREKATIVRKSGILEVIETQESLDNVGGLENMKEWLRARSECFTKEARDFGIEPPKGMLLIGVPGSGKSLAIKSIASAWHRTCLRLDMGRIFGSYVGESEGNIKEVLDVAAASAPAVLWLDEIEKGLSGNKAGMESHETTRRVFQILLTWMQDRKEDVFIAATANSIKSLPPELLRSGRIDIKFWVDLPDATQRQEIIAIHLRKRGRDIATYQKDIVRLVNACDTFTGAEIETWIKESLVRAFHKRHADLKTEDLLETVGDITPISKLSAQEIEESRRWAADHGIKNASITHDTIAMTPAPTPRKSRKVEISQQGV